MFMKRCTQDCHMLHLQKSQKNHHIMCMCNIITCMCLHFHFPMILLFSHVHFSHVGHTVSIFHVITYVLFMLFRVKCTLYSDINSDYTIAPVLEVHPLIKTLFTV